MHTEFLEDDLKEGHHQEGLDIENGMKLLVDPKGTRLIVANWSHWVQNGDHCPAFVNVVMNLQVPKSDGNF